MKVPTPNAPAGWYSDPQQPGSQRYWDGRAWTERTLLAPVEGWYEDPDQPGGQRYWDGQSWTNWVAPGPQVDEQRTASLAPARRGRTTAIALTVLVLAASAGAGAYFVGRSTGEDLDAARAAGAAAGRKAGTAKGAKEGYAEGFKIGRQKGYQATYADAYKKAYRNAFKDAGLTVPEKVSVPEQP